MFISRVGTIAGGSEPRSGIATLLFSSVPNSVYNTMSMLPLWEYCHGAENRENGLLSNSSHPVFF